MATRRQEKFISLLRTLISGYLLKLDFKKRIVGVTRLDIAEDLKSAKIFISVYPEDGEKEVLKILATEKGEIKNYIASKTSVKYLPEIFFEIDKGEKNRQRIEELLSAERPKGHSGGPA